MKGLETKAELLKEKFGNYKAIGYVLNQLETQNSTLTPKEKNYLHKTAYLFYELANKFATFPRFSGEESKKLNFIYSKFYPGERLIDDKKREEITEGLKLSLEYVKSLIFFPKLVHSNFGQERVLKTCKVIESVYKPTVKEQIASIFLY